MNKYNQGKADGKSLLFFKDLKICSGQNLWRSVNV